MYFPNSDPLALIYHRPRRSAVELSIMDFSPPVSRTASVTAPPIPTWAMNYSVDQFKSPVWFFNCFAQPGGPFGAAVFSSAALVLTEPLLAAREWNTLCRIMFCCSGGSTWLTAETRTLTKSLIRLWFYITVSPDSSACYPLALFELSGATEEIASLSPKERSSDATFSAFSLVTPAKTPYIFL